MVATQDEEVLRVLDLVGQKQADCLEGLLAAIHVVAQEEIVRFRGEASILEQTEEIIVLTVDVPAYLVPRQQGRSDQKKRTLIGASSSSRMGWLMKISRDLVHSQRISCSCSWTCLPGRLPRTSNSRAMMSSRFTSSSAMVNG